METSVSVIIPTYNDDHDSLTKSVNSALKQSLPTSEIIIVDDGSNTPLPFFNNSSVKVLRLPVNRGVAAARNEGVANATSDLIAFLDAGDWWEPEKIERQVYLYQENPNYGLIYCGAKIHTPSNVKRTIPSPIENHYRELLVRQCITGSASSALIPRKVFLEVNGFYTSRDIPEDRDLWLRIANRYPIGSMPSPLTHLQDTSDSRSSDPEKKKFTYEEFLKIHEDEIRKNNLWRQAKAHYNLVIGLKYLNKKKTLIGLTFLTKALIARPLYYSLKIATRVRGKK